MVTEATRSAAVLWTGGKDSCLAMHEARRRGYQVRCLVTFAPEDGRFLAHPLAVMRLQARSLGLAHRIIRVGQPYEDGYREAIRTLGRDEGICALVTGDIAEVDAQPNWVRQCARSTGVRVLTPLWGRDRSDLLEDLLSSGFRVVLSCVKRPWFTLAWLGRAITPELLGRLNAARSRTGLDLCGENGEYHTLALDGPGFSRPVELQACTKRRRGGVMYLDVGKARLGRPTSPPPERKP